MTPTELIADLRARGIILSVVDSRLRVDAPRGVITADIREWIATHKAKLMELLLRPPSPPYSYLCQRHTRCWRCAVHTDNYWVCGICHPPYDGQIVEWW